jgi:hypothetical protein
MRSLDKTEVMLYLRNRTAKGFNVAMMVIMAEQKYVPSTVLLVIALTLSSQRPRA